LFERCRLYDLQCKDIINLADGRRLGQVYDLEFDESTGRILSLIIPGQPRFFGLFGRREDTVIPWGDIRKIGRDSVLVDRPAEGPGELQKPWGF